MGRGTGGGRRSPRDALYSCGRARCLGISLLLFEWRLSLLYHTCADKESGAIVFGSKKITMYRDTAICRDGGCPTA